MQRPHRRTLPRGRGGFGEDRGVDYHGARGTDAGDELRGYVIGGLGGGGDQGRG